MTIRARMQLVLAQPLHTANSADVCTDMRLMAVSDPGGGYDSNAAWMRSLSRGELTLMVTNPDALGEFEVGKFYDIEIKAVEPEPEDEAGE